MAVPGLGGFELELKYCSRRSESLHSEQPPSKVFYDAYYTYPVLSSKKHKQHFLLELSFPSQPPPPFGPFLQGPIHFYQPDLTAPLSVHHLKSNVSSIALHSQSVKVSIDHCSFVLSTELSLKFFSILCSRFPIISPFLWTTQTITARR